jgi:hypothetical protein
VLLSTANTGLICEFLSYDMLSDQKCYENKLSFMSSSPSIIRLNLNNLINKAIDLHVKDGNIVGIGSGSTIVYAVQRLRQRVLQENIQVKCVPTSFQVSVGLFHFHRSPRKSFKCPGAGLLNQGILKGEVSLYS